MDFVHIRKAKSNAETLHENILNYFSIISKITISMIISIICFLSIWFMTYDNLSVGNNIFIALLFTGYFLCFLSFVILNFPTLLEIKRKEYSFKIVLIDEVDVDKRLSFFVTVAVKDNAKSTEEELVDIWRTEMKKIKTQNYDKAYLIKLNKKQEQYRLVLL